MAQRVLKGTLTASGSLATSLDDSMKLSPALREKKQNSGKHLDTLPILFSDIFLEGKEPKCLADHLMKLFLFLNLQGPKGSKGDLGTPGLIGQKGERGEVGMTGPSVCLFLIAFIKF